MNISQRQKVMLYIDITLCSTYILRLEGKILIKSILIVNYTRLNYTSNCTRLNSKLYT